MSNHQRFLLDEHIHLAVAEGLRRLAFDVFHVCETDLSGTPDDQILKKTVELNRILVTRDVRDFSRIARLFLGIERSFPGILLVPPSIPHKDPGTLILAVEKWANKYGRIDQISGGIAWLSPAELEDDDRRIKESEPSYLRALQRIGA